jgi:hypothetical protein
MKFAKSILTGTGAVVLAGLILALLAPKAAHAVAATAVQIVNTSGDPAVTQGILPGQQFVQMCEIGGGATPTPGCNLTPAVPSGFIFHATQQSVLVSLSVFQPSTPVSWFYPSSGTLVGLNEYPQAGTNASLGGQFANVTNHDWYIDAGGQAGCVAASVTGPGQITCAVTGYLTH